MSAELAKPQLSLVFVDDDVQLLDGLRRMLRRNRAHWNMAFTSSPDEVLERVTREPVDVVVSDMRMPELNGAGVLRRTLQRAPRTVRMILSGQMHAMHWFQCLGPGQRVLTKPCAAERLESAVAEAWSFEQLCREARAAEPESWSALPPPPIFERLYDALERESPPEELESTAFAPTQALPRVLEVLLRGEPRGAVQWAEASEVLGRDLAHALAIGIHGVEHVLAGAGGEPVVQLWERAARTAAHARAIALSEHAEIAVVQQAVAACFLREIAALLPLPAREGESAEASELSRARSGACVLRGWGLPDAVCEAVAFHAAPARAPSAGSGPITYVHAAWALERADASGPSFDRGYLQRLGLVDRAERWARLRMPAASGGGGVP